MLQKIVTDFPQIAAICNDGDINVTAVENCVKVMDISLLQNLGKRQSKCQLSFQVQDAQ